MEPLKLLCILQLIPTTIGISSSLTTTCSNINETSCFGVCQPIWRSCALKCSHDYLVPCGTYQCQDLNVPTTCCFGNFLTYGNISCEIGPSYIKGLLKSAPRDPHEEWEKFFFQSQCTDDYLYWCFAPGEKNVTKL